MFTSLFKCRSQLRPQNTPKKKRAYCFLIEG